MISLRECDVLCPYCHAPARELVDGPDYWCPECEKTFMESDLIAEGLFPTDRQEVKAINWCQDNLVEYDSPEDAVLQYLFVKENSVTGSGPTAGDDKG